MFKFMPIPKVFFPFLEDEPFQTCTVCQRDLLACGVDYLIEKTYKGTEVICEYAVCMECGEDMSTELSAESMLRIRAHMEERVDLLARGQRLAESSPDEIQTLAGALRFDGYQAGKHGRVSHLRALPRSGSGPQHISLYDLWCGHE